MGKQRQWQSPEVVALCKSYVALSMDSVRGNEQKSSDFWLKVVEDAGLGGTRSPEASKKRFADVRKACFKFHTIKTRVMQTPVSGWGEEEYHEKIMKQYKDQNEKKIAFEFFEELEILSKLPKFNVHRETPRPPGRNAAKKKVIAEAQKNSEREELLRQKNEMMREYLQMKKKKNKRRKKERKIDQLIKLSQLDKSVVENNVLVKHATQLLLMPSSTEKESREESDAEDCDSEDSGVNLSVTRTLNDNFISENEQ